jgi:DNA repair protein RecO (recombination protein O)
MSLVVTDAIVLHAFDYLESSRILKLVTREAGVRSVLARGARRSKKRFGTSLDLYAQGSAELQMKDGRELDTLSGFDVARARPQLATQLSRFTGASAIAELTLRFARDAADPGLFDAVESALDAIGAAPPNRARDVTLGGAWRVLRELGVAPTVDVCAECHASIDRAATAMFSHPAGGTLCERCGHLARSGRSLPPAARDALRDWLSGDEHPLPDPQSAHAHQRLLREFLAEHLTEDRPLRAFDVWERETLTGAETTAESAAGAA